MNQLFTYFLIISSLTVITLPVVFILLARFNLFPKPAWMMRDRIIEEGQQVEKIMRSENNLETWQIILSDSKSPYLVDVNPYKLTLNCNSYRKPLIASSIPLVEGKGQYELSLRIGYPGIGSLIHSVEEMEKYRPGTMVVYPNEIISVGGHGGKKEKVFQVSPLPGEIISNISV